MGNDAGIRVDQHLFGGNAPFIEELYERYLADPGVRVAPSGAATSTSCKRRRAPDVAHAPVVESFARARAATASVAGAMVDETTMHKQVLVLRLISSTACSACCTPTSIR